MSIVKKVIDLQDRVASELEILGFPQHLVEGLTDRLFSHILINQLDKNVLGHETYNVATHAMLLDDHVLGQDVVDIIVSMMHKAREQSHGSAILSKVFVSEDVYKEILEASGADENTVCTVQKVRILPSRAVPSHFVLGLCTPKHENVPLKMMTIGGVIERKKDASK